MQPLRIAALQPSISVTLQALGALDLLVACTRYCVDAVPALATGGVQVIHDAWTASTSELLAAQPSLVLAAVPYRMESLAAILKAGCTVVALAPKCLDDVYADTLLLGRLVDRSIAATQLVQRMQSSVEAVRARSRLAGHRPRVYCEEWGKPLIHSQPWVADLVEAAGGEPIGVAGAVTSAEAVAAADPDVLVFAWCGAGDRVPLEKMVEQRGWQHLQSVRAGRVYCIPDEWLNTPAPTLIRGLCALAAALHPATFVEMEAPRSLAASPRQLFRLD